MRQITNIEIVFAFLATDMNAQHKKAKEKEMRNNI
jgi:hypothetical protein